ncbi:MAG: Flp pilus assembly complex ATPase component TadA [Burkholderiales bacterium]|nr:Flp pilus assembly complex ATPase component TadA [Burkholderiales bacterium]
MSAAENMPPKSVIDSYRDIPQGILLSRVDGEFPMSDEWRQMFAVLRSVDIHYLVVATTFFGSAHMFELRRRMQEAGLDNIQILHTTPDVVQLLYHEAANNNRNSKDGEYTDIEALAAEIISAAAAQGASDIHIESRDHRANVFFRVNGTRRFHRDLTAANAHSLGVVLYSVHADAGSKEVSWDPNQVMDGALEWVTVTGATYQLRFSSAPIYPTGGFHIVIRLLSMEATGLDIDKLGYSSEQKSMLDIMSSGSSGMVILCGPTNSGKSTTLQALMGRIYQRRGDTIKMITVEDPVEYVIPGACQISVARKRKTLVDHNTGSAFTTFLRGTLRQDPDVVMVGEIRDHDSASVVKDLVLAGRKLLATLHTYSALGAYIRLREIGVPWEVLTMPGFVAGVVYQRLVPLICPECSIPLVGGGAARIPRETLFRVQQVSDLTSDNVRVKGDGCPHCSHTGYSGRTVCAEFVLPDRILLRHLTENNFLEAERYWRKSGVGAIDGGVTALAHGIHKMRHGLVSPMDIEDQIGLLTADMVVEDSIISNNDVNTLSGYKG